MSIIVAIVTAFSCFSAIPMPNLPWDERNMRHMMAAFPLVGAVIGVSLWLWWLVSEALGFGFLLRSAGLTVLPIAISGGIHMDGFADVIDAQSSHASQERKREILKDPHAGAFAIVAICCYLLAFCSLAGEIDARELPLCIGIPILSRCLSGFATVSYRPARTDGMYAAENGSADRRSTRLALAALFALVGTGLIARDAIVALAMLASGIATMLAVRHLAEKEYGGMSGDLAGFLLQVSELVMLACIVVVGRLV